MHLAGKPSRYFWGPQITSRIILDYTKAHQSAAHATPHFLISSRRGISTTTRNQTNFTMASPSLSTLHHVTERKLKSLATHREKFEADKKAILSKVAAAPDTRAKVQELLDGFEVHGITSHQDDLSMRNMELFIHQAKHDSSVSDALLRDWQSKLERELDIGTVKYEYAALFGRLVTEWIKHPNPSVSPATTPAVSGNDSDSEIGKSFDQLGRKEMHEQREKWESYAFQDKKVDQAKLEAYLDSLFSAESQIRKLKESPIEILRDAMPYVMDFKSELHTLKREDDKDDKNVDRIPFRHRFDVNSLKSSIKGVLHSDLLAGKKREALVDLESQPTVLAELVDVLNMDLDGLDTWAWDPSPVPMNMRRQLNGKYRVYMDEETHQAVLLHFVGKVWAVSLKDAFVSVFRSGAWLHSPYRAMNKKARHRREYFVPGSTSRSMENVRNKRWESYMQEYFMTQLPNIMDEDYVDYAAEDQDTSAREQIKKGRSPLATKQAMLRLVTAEMLVNSKVYNEFTLLQSDFKMFGPSLSHDAIFTVLKYFGVPDKWIRFFKKFLQAPIYFAQDGESEGQVRKCGIPMSHLLSDALSEAVLFCLDFAVNKKTGGANIYRFHDDLWFWGQEEACVKAWNAMKDFADVMGLELNTEKTGAALIVADKSKARSLSPELPHGDVKWGFLVLDASAGRWVIDRAQVDEHIEELRRQLGACRSVMAWVQAWNSYVDRFFSTNFGHPAHCFGRKHNEMIIETFEHIQKTLFAKEGTANAADYLCGMLKERFETDDSVPDAFIYYPSELGGLGLRNPFIDLFLTHKYLPKDTREELEQVYKNEQESYDRAKDEFNRGLNRPNKPMTAADPSDEPFMSFEEFMRYPEETSVFLATSYKHYMEPPRSTTIERKSEIAGKVKRSGNRNEDEYWYWIYMLYSGEVKERFGGDGLQLGERGLLPVGLVDVLRGEKVRWDG